PANPNQYRYHGAWEDMRVMKDTIPVKGQASAAVDLKFTRHGPVLKEDLEHHKAYALRAAWMETGAAPYLASLRMDQARTWEEFVEACTFSRIPSENMVWADREAHIGYQAVAITPLRLQGGRNHAAAAELVGPGAGAGRWPLRMERLPADRRAAARRGPGQGV